jgi:hypothetical protein
MNGGPSGSSHGSQKQFNYLESDSQAKNREQSFSVLRVNESRKTQTLEAPEEMASSSAVWLQLGLTKFKYRRSQS